MIADIQALRFDRDDECNGEWLLKNSIFLKTAKICGIENVWQNRERRL
jgi:hypothetical protein